MASHGEDPQPVDNSVDAWPVPRGQCSHPDAALVPVAGEPNAVCKDCGAVVTIGIVG